MTQSPDQPARVPPSVRPVNAITRGQNIASAALAMLNAPARISTKAPPPQVIVTDAGFALQVDDDVTTFKDAAGLSKALADLPEREIDLVFEGRTSLDVVFNVPNGPFSDLEAMIDTELAFRSPFQRDQCVWFWTANETEQGDWQVDAAIVLKSTLAPAAQAITETRKAVLHAQRYRTDGTLRIGVRPSWMTPKRGMIPAGMAQRWRSVPRDLRLPIAGFVFLLFSFTAVSVVQNVRHSDLSDRASAADADLRRIAAAQTTSRALEERQALGLTKLALVGTLAGILPDDYWLEQVIIEDDSLVITGYGPSAAEVTRLLSDVPTLSDIQFGSPVTRDNSQNLERYRINAIITGIGG